MFLNDDLWFSSISHSLTETVFLLNTDLTKCKFDSSLGFGFSEGILDC